MSYMEAYLWHILETIKKNYVFIDIFEDIS